MSHPSVASLSHSATHCEITYRDSIYPIPLHACIGACIGITKDIQRRNRRQCHHDLQLRSLLKIPLVMNFMIYFVYPRSLSHPKVASLSYPVTVIILSYHGHTLRHTMLSHPQTRHVLISFQRLHPCSTAHRRHNGPQGLVLMTCSAAKTLCE